MRLCIINMAYKMHTLFKYFIIETHIPNYKKTILQESDYNYYINILIQIYCLYFFTCIYFKLQ